MSASRETLSLSAKDHPVILGRPQVNGGTVSNQGLLGEPHPWCLLLFLDGTLEPVMPVKQVGKIVSVPLNSWPEAEEGKRAVISSASGPAVCSLQAVKDDTKAASLLLHYQVKMHQLCYRQAALAAFLSELAETEMFGNDDIHTLNRLQIGIHWAHVT